MRGTVLLDRDGTLIEEKNYLSNPKDVRLIKNAGIAIAKLKISDFQIFVVSNQSGIGRGYFTEADLIKVHKKIDKLLSEYDTNIDGYYFCPHNPNEKSKCNCRKPSIGLLEQIKKENEINNSNLWMIGDKFSDIQFALNGKMKPILVKTGYGSEINDYDGLVFDSIFEASKWIINESK